MRRTRKDLILTDAEMKKAQKLYLTTDMSKTAIQNRFPGFKKQIWDCLKGLKKPNGLSPIRYSEPR